jgi:hypothetical protein
MADTHKIPTSPHTGGVPLLWFASIHLRYTKAGVISEYARSVSGSLDDTVIMYLNIR